MAQKTASPQAPEPGLYIIGQVMSRRRRKFDKKGGGFRYNIALVIQAGGVILTPERWCDLPTPSDAPAIGEEVSLPVTLSTYTGKTGTNFRLNWGPPADAETF